MKHRFDVRHTIVASASWPVLGLALLSGGAARAQEADQSGTSYADIVVVGSHYGRVRTMYDHRGDGLKEAGPSVPAEITGLGGVPGPGG